MSDPTDKRGVPREPVHLVTTIERDGAEIGCGVSRDANGRGFLLLSHLSIPPGAEITLRTFVPNEDEPRRLTASVLRCERTQPSENLVWDYRIAVAFRDPPPDLQALVLSLTKR
jgi:hypothetical protein